MDLRTVYLIWPDGMTPDKCYSFTDIIVYEAARKALDDAKVVYGHAVVPLLGDEETLNYLIKEMLP